MSTAETQISDTSETRATGRMVKKIVVGLLCGVLSAFLGLEAMSLLAAQRTESQRREVGMAGGECEFEHRVPTWLQFLAGEDSHSFMDYPVIVGVTMAGAKIGNASLAKLPEIPDLRKLDLHDSQVTSDGLHQLTRWKSLRTLDLGNTPVTDVTPLAALPHLESLQLNFSQVRRERLAGLTQLKSLLALGAGFIQVTDQDVIEIAKCPQLVEVNISASDLGEHGLQPLTSLEQLNMLVLVRAKYAAADLEAFQAARPGVTIIK
ncbi:MAG: leucine-rich repeat domain-containing protein [Planctomycetaceae bacterium]